MKDMQIYKINDGDYLKIDDLVEMLYFNSKSGLYKFLKKKPFKLVKIRRFIFVSLDSLLQYLEKEKTTIYNNAIICLKRKKETKLRCVYRPKENDIRDISEKIENLEKELNILKEKHKSKLTELNCLTNNKISIDIINNDIVIKGMSSITKEEEKKIIDFIEDNYQEIRQEALLK